MISTMQSFVALAVAAIAGSVSTPVNNELSESVAIIRARAVIPACQNCAADFAELGGGGTIWVHKFVGAANFAQHSPEPSLEIAFREARLVGGPSDLSLETPKSIFESYVSEDAEKKECDDSHYSCHGEWMQGYCAAHNPCKAEESMDAAEAAAQLTDVRAVVAVLKNNRKLRLSDDNKFIRVTDCNARLIADVALKPVVTAELTRFQGH